MRAITSTLFGLGLLALTACKPDAVVDDIGININVKNSDLVGTAFVTEKNISTEQGNPYGQFLSDIEAEFGDNGASIFLDSASLVLAAGGTQANLEEIYVGEVSIALVDETNNVETIIATVLDPLGAGPIELDVQDVFDDEIFQATLNSGSFKVRVSGEAADPNANVNVDLDAVLSFSAFE